MGSNRHVVKVKTMKVKMKANAAGKKEKKAESVLDLRKENQNYFQERTERRSESVAVWRKEHTWVGFFLSKIGGN
jgi:hypothetical protein